LHVTADSKETSLGIPGSWQLLFEVIDTGQGIAKERLSHIFEQFEQAEKNTTRRYGGTGLGLAIARSLVDAMGGELQVESVLGQGSRFFFTLPMNEVEGKTAEQHLLFENLDIIRPNFLKDKHILVAEDNPTLQDVIITLLEGRGAKVTLAKNGEEAVSLVKQKKDIGLMLMDIQMPIMDGHQATREIRQQFDKSQLPIIAMTASAMKEDKEMAFAHGMNAYLVKPVSLERLIQELVNLNFISLDDLGIQKNGKSQDQDSIDISAVLSYPGINLDMALANMGNMSKLYKDTAKTVIATMPEHLQNLAEAVERQDAVSVEKKLHTIKGMVAQLGATELADWLKLQIQNLKSGVSVAKLPKIEQHAVAKIAEVMTGLKEIIQQM